MERQEERVTESSLEKTSCLASIANFPQPEILLLKIPNTGKMSINILPGSAGTHLRVMK
jgi:hypothetical protein